MTIDSSDNVRPIFIVLFPWLRLLLGLHAFWRLQNKYKYKLFAKAKNTKNRPP